MHGVGLPHLQIGTADHHALILLFYLAGQNRAALFIRHGDGPRRAAEIHQHRYLGGAAAEVFGHAHGPRGDQGAPGDGGGAGAVQGAVAAVGGARNHDRAAGDGQIAVGVDAVAVRVDIQRAARNQDAGYPVGGKHIVPAKAALIIAARGVEPVVLGVQPDFPAADFDILPLQPLVAFCDVHASAHYVQRAARVNAVVPGGDGKFAAGNMHVRVGMDGVVRRVNGKGSAQNGDRAAGLDALFAFGISIGRGVIPLPAAKAHVLHVGFPHFRAAPGGQIKGATHDQDIALVAFVVLGPEGVLFRYHGEIAVVDPDGIVGVDAPALGGDGIDAAGEFHVVLAHDAVLDGGDRQAACAVENDIVPGKYCGVHVAVGAE